MKIIIITEGSGEIGFGHVTRCMSLYQAFRENELSVQFVVNGDSTIEPILTDTEYEIFNWLENPERLFNKLNNQDIVFIDSYLADKDFYEKISELTALTIYIDDNIRIDYPKGIVINGTILAEEMNYPLTENIEYLLGSQYIPLRHEFWDIGVKEIRSALESIMITFGGDDLKDLTPGILKVLINEYPHINKKIVIGRGFKNITEIENLKDKKTELIYYPDANGMLKLMIESDIAISAGGQTLYELARIGLPTVAVGMAYNQVNNVENWKKAGFIEFAGFWDDENLYDSILEKLDLLKDKKIRIEKCKKGREFVDGEGAIKIVKRCLNKYYKEGMKLRTAESKDIYNIYELSNEYEVRQNSFNNSKIEFKDHEKWFKNKLEDFDNIFLVVESMENFIGQVRLDLEGDEATISISINNEFRALGLGKNIIEKSIDYLKLNNSHIKIIKAYIKESNKKSISLFKKMDFKYMENVWMKNQNALLYIYKIRD